jgi:hypothetical protein
MLQQYHVHHKIRDQLRATYPISYPEYPVLGNADYQGMIQCS